MTEQEVQVFAARLERVWEPIEARTIVNIDDEWLFCAVIKPRVRLEIQGTGEVFLSFYSEDPPQCELASFQASRDGEVAFWPAYEQDKERAGKLATKWCAFFRRNCWLCGVPIEATAHEKMEWSQGFSPEEIEAWNLKM